MFITNEILINSFKMNHNVKHNLVNPVHCIFISCTINFTGIQLIINVIIES